MAIMLMENTNDLRPPLNCVSENTFIYFWPEEPPQILANGSYRINLFD